MRMVTMTGITPSDCPGGCLVSRNVLDGNGSLRWVSRQESADSHDTGWRFFSDVDTKEFLDDPDNVATCDFAQMAEIEPAVLGIYHLPVGADLQIAVIGDRVTFYDNVTAEELTYTGGRFEY